MLNWRGRYLIVDYGLSFNAIPKKSEGRGGEKKNKKKIVQFDEKLKVLPKEIFPYASLRSHIHMTVQ